MRNKMKGQQNIRRPLPIRIMALVMAVVMVFSVVYINNRKDVVKAEPDEPAEVGYVSAPNGTHDSTLTASDYDESETLTVNVPAKNVAVYLNTKRVDEVGNYSIGGIQYEKLYKKDDASAEGAEFVIANTKPDGYTQYIVFARAACTVKWYKGDTVAKVEDGSEEKYGVLSAEGDVVAKLQARPVEILDITDDDGDAPISDELKTQISNEIKATYSMTLSTVTVKTFKLHDINLEKNVSSKKVSLSDPDITNYTEGSVTLGSIRYKIWQNPTTIEDGEPQDQGASICTYNEALELLNSATDAKDGIFYVKKLVIPVLDGNELGNDAFKVIKSIERDFYIGLNPEVSVTQGTKTGTVADNEITLTKAVPNKAITIGFTPTEDIEYKITKKSTDGPAPSAGDTETSVTTGEDVLITLPGAIDNKGVSAQYELTLDNGTVSVKKTISISYDDGKPVISSFTLDGNEVTSGATITTTKESLNSVLNASIAESEATLAKTTLKAGTADEADWGTFSNGVSTTALTGYEKGETSYSVKAYSSYETASEPFTFKVFYDPDPVVVTPTVKQGGTEVTGKVTCKKDTVVSFTLDDGTGSGIKADSFTVKNLDTDEPVTLSSNSFTIAANYDEEDNNEGKTLRYSYTVEDNAGNKTEGTINVAFYNEEATVTDYSITYKGTTNPRNRYSTNIGEASYSGIGWDEEEVLPSVLKRSFDVNYTIESEVMLDSIELNGDIATASKDSFVEDDDYTYDATTGKYTYNVTLNLEFDKDKEKIYKDGNALSLKITNKNGVPTPHDITLLIVDLVNPSASQSVDSSEGSATIAGENGWYQNLALIINATDTSAGISQVTGTGLETSTIPIENGVGTAVVAESADDTGTEVVIKAIDNAGNTYETDPVTYKVDKHDPTASITVDGAEVTGNVYKTSFDAIGFSAADEGPSGIQVTKTKVEYYDAETDVVISSWEVGSANNKSLEALIGDTPQENKPYAFRIIATDNSGRSITKTATFYIDNTPPEVSAEIQTKEPKTSGFFTGDVKVKLGRKENNVKTSSVSDGKNTYNPTWEEDPDKPGWERAFITVTDAGTYKVTYTLTDQSDISKKATTNTFTIDKTPPAVTTLLNGSEYTKDNSYNKTVTTGISYSDDNKDDNDVTATIVRDIPGGGQTTTTKKGVGPHTISEDGYYSVTYKVIDKAGNTTTTYPIGFTVDNTAPVHNLYVTTANPSKVEDYPNNYINGVGKWQSSHEAYRYGQFYNGDVTVELNYFDYNLDWVYVTDNGEEISPSWTKNGAFGKATYTFTSEGYHDVQIWSKDLSGNETNDTVLGKRVRFTIDRSAPSITTYLNSSLYSEGSGTRYLNTNGSLNVSVSEGNKDTYDLTRYYKMTPPGGTAKTGEDKVDEGTENYSEEADYEVSYVAVDKAGNKSATRNVYFRVDRTAPKLTINGPGSSSNASSTSVSFNVQESFYWDMTSCTVKIYKKVDGSGEVLEKTLDMNPTSANYSQSYSFVDDAEYRMEFTAEDKCGNKSQTDYTFIKDGNAPSILLSGVKNYDKTDKNVELTVTIEEAFYTSNRVTLSGTRTDIDGKSHKIDFDDFATNRTKISQLQQMFKEDGIYDITVTSTDKAGNSSSKTVHFTIDTTDPVIGDLSKYDGVKLNNFKWDVDLDKLVKDLTVCDIKVYLDGALYDGTSDIEDGSHVLKVEATDELGHSSSKEVTFVLDSKAPNIIVMNVEEGDNLLESTDITVTVELDEDSLDTVTLNDKAINIANNEGKITVNEKGDYVLNATAHDEAGNVSSVEIKFSYGKQTNLLFIGIIAGAAILLLLLLLVFLRRRRNDN